MSLPYEFSRSFLLALSATRKQEYLPVNDNFYQAFGTTMDKTKELSELPDITSYPSPFTGSFPDANDLLMQGIDTLFLSSNPPLFSGVTFNRSKESSLERLKRYNCSESYRTLAEHFWEHL